MPDRVAICVTDLDGTLLHSERHVSAANLEILHELGRRNITRIIATGRSYYSLERVLPTDLPIDYVIFSTGAGIMNWQERRIIYSSNLDGDHITLGMGIFNELRIDYALHHPVPETHRFFYVIGEGCPDFYRRCDYYAEFMAPLTAEDLPVIRSATQFLAITEPERMADVERLRTLLAPMTVIRTTSPLDHRSLWIEVFAPGVNKGAAVLYIAEMLACPLSRIMVIGNDYNDLDMLRLGAASYVTGNAPDELRGEFQSVAHHDDDAFAEAVQDWLSQG